MAPAGPRDPEAGDQPARPAAETLVDVLRRRAAEQPDDVVFTYLVDGESAEVHLTFGALWYRALAIAHTLCGAGLAGERALLIYPPGLDYAPALFGCFLAGVVAVPEGPPDPRRPERSLPRLRAVSANARAAAVLTVGELVSVRDAAPESMRGLPWIATDAIDGAPPTDMPSPAPDALAYLQYTSGSTADPKGVMLTHRHLIANCDGIARRCEPSFGDTLVAWVPTFHDLGLIYAVSLPIHSGIRAVSFAAADFARRPARWPQALSRYRATHTVGPDTAYAITAHKTRPEERAGLDLSALRMALSGAESIHRETEERFVEVFAPVGFRPSAFCHAFGLSEATAQVSGEVPSERMAFLRVDADALAAGRIELADDTTAHTRDIASCGPPTEGTEVIVADPVTRAVQPASQIGELWVRSPSVGLGYWDAPEATAESFGAIAPDGTGPWLRTGDRGFLHTGRIFVAGRIKELIIVRGQNHYPQDLEASIQGTHPAIRPGAIVAFSVDSESGEQVLIVAEVRPDRVDEPEAIYGPMRAALAQHGLRPGHIALVTPGAIPRTTSGKLQRLKARAMLLDGRLTPLHSAGRLRTPDEARPSPSERSSIAPRRPGDRQSLLEAVLVAAREVHGDPDVNIVPDRPLSEVGFDSAMLAEYARRVEDIVGRSLPMPLFFDHPTPAALTDWVIGEMPIARAAAPKPSDDDAIVITGMACRLPGGVADTDTLWRLLDDGMDAIDDFPSDRGWDIERLYDPDPGAIGRSYIRQGGFIDAPGDFDPAFFGISPREARLMDPQQRLLLELAWEAIERSGLAADDLRESRTGVFAGLWTDGYDRLAPDATDATDGYPLLGSSVSVAAGRVAYTLGLHGPAMTIDTACSSSLVALHQAAKALRDGECDLALAGGVTVFPTADPFIWFSRLRTLAPDGRSKAFAASADGAGWSEGAGLVMLTRMSEARRRGLPVLAIVRGSAINQDGRSQGLTAPNGPSQRRVIRDALAAAGLDPADVDAVEAHGTGTALGDPIEAGALLATYGQRDPKRPLRLGAIKSNIGHTQAAAGIAGLMKMVLALQNARLPATLHVDAPSPHVDWASGAVELLTEATPWPSGERLRRAGISAFGISGTNAHVIIEEPPADAMPAPDAMPASLPLLVSGRDTESLRAQARSWTEWLTAHPDADHDAVRRTAALGRSHLSHRATIYGTLVEALAALAAGESHADAIDGVSESRGGAVFVLPGHGSQWHGMGHALLAASEAFADAIDACDAALAPHTGWSVRAVLAGDADAPSLERVDVVQPALFAMAVGLAAVWRSHGVEPVAVVGHSVGGIAAAVVADALSLEDGAWIVALRGRLIAGVERRGAMLSTGLSAEALAARLAGTALSLAVVNGANSSVASGDGEAIGALEAELKSEGVPCRRVAIGFAAHSEHMDGILDAFVEAIDGITLRPASVPIYSAVTGARIDGGALGVDYWRRNIRDVVRFDRAVDALAADGYGVFVELGGHPVLAAALSDAIGDGAVVGSLRRDGGIEQLHRALGALHVAGCDIDWHRVMGAGPMASLPTYAFQRQRYWLDPKPRADAVSAGQVVVDHPLLSASVALADDDAIVLTGRLSVATSRWLTDHRVFGAAVAPGTALLDLALTAGRAIGCPQLAELTLESPLVLPEPGSLALQVRVGEPGPSGRRGVSIHTRPDDDARWATHARGTLGDASKEADGIATWPPVGRSLDIDGVYERLADAGLDYGPGFRNLSAAWRSADGIHVTVELPEALDDAGFGLHPALLDAALHALALGAPDGATRLPFVWADVTLHATGARALRCHLRPGDDADAPIEIRAYDGAGAPVLVGRLTTRPASRVDPTRAHDLYRLDWRPVGLPTGEPDTAGWVIIGGSTLPDAISRVADSGALPAAPTRIIIDTRSATALDGSDATEATTAALATLQALLADERQHDTPVVWLTDRAIATGPGDAPGNLAHAPLWGLLRSARAENPARVLRAVDGSIDAFPLACLTLDDEPEMALRFGVALAPRLVDAGRRRDLLTAPAPGGQWHLDPAERQGLDGVRALTLDETPLTEGMVEVDVRAAGMNFRDVLNAMGMVPTPWLGLEFAGVVTAVGPGVDDLRPGDRVMGLGQRTFATRARATRWGITPMPPGMDFVAAATTPLVYLTALYGLVDLAALRPGERVLIHAAAGGVGMAAMQVARHIGAEVFGTASPPKWGVLRALGLADDRIANSRTLDFEPAFMAATGGEGVDVVLDALAGEFVDASLRLMPRGGRFIEMGKADVRDADAVARRHPGVRYCAFDLIEAGAERTQQLLCTLARWLETGALTPLPCRVYDLREARAAFDHMSKARHVGKLVLQPPRPLAGPALITGGFGELGRALARHLVEVHGIERLVLTSRRGMDAPGAGALVADLAERGAKAVIVPCDVSDRAQVEALLAEHTVSAVFHLAGVLDDGITPSLTAERMASVMAPKALGAWHLHTLTADRDLSAFVLFSSLAGTLGGPGQGNYAAANAFLDALAAHRRAQGLPAQSLAWGLWEQQGLGMTAQLGEAELRRMARDGFSPLAIDYGLALLDAALARPEAALVPVRLDRARLAKRGDPAPVWSTLIRPVASVVRADGSGGRRATDGDRIQPAAAHRLVAAATASVLGHGDPGAIDPEAGFTDLGLDSLMAVELRNRLRRETGLELTSTIVFDHPSVELLARHIVERLAPSVPALVETPSETDAASIAITGVGLRLPGGITDLDGLWGLLRSGCDAIGPVPADRFDIEPWYDPHPDAAGRSYVRAAACVDDPLAFDPGPFGISPWEAEHVDPQHRLLLEAAWEALERAGLPPLGLRDASIGAFVGIGPSAGPSEVGGAFGISGSDTSFAAGRLAYTFGFQGPALAVNTACSSSLVALHLAVRALRAGECEQAIAAGVSVFSGPQGFVALSGTRALAPDGRSKTFSAAADGYGRGEGAVVVVLQPLAAALAAGRPVLGVIRGTATNHDGASSGITAPNGTSQQKVIRAALDDAGLEPSAVDAIECHGTGTQLGDPIEVHALAAVYGEGRSTPIELGSIKPSIGHLESAAGLAGLARALVALTHRIWPGTPHALPLNPHIEWDQLPVRVDSASRPWVGADRPRRIGVSSFGMSGTNAHVIVESGPPPPTTPDAVDPHVPLLVSARDAEALRDQATRWADWLTARSTADLGAIRRTGALGRSHLAYRVAVHADAVDGIVDALRHLADDRPHAATVADLARPLARAVFVLPGHGSQWPGMGRALLSASPVFADAIAACDAALAPHTGWSVRDVLAGAPDAPLAERVDVVQPCLFAMGIGLTAAWRALGVEPSAVVGHSVGEIAAAVVAGALSLDDGARIVALRGALIAKVPRSGAMLATRLSADALAARSAPWGERLDVSVVNGPHSAVASGDLDAIEALEATLGDDGIRCSRVRIDFAAHSHHMDGILDDFERGIDGITPRASTLPMYSAVTGELIAGVDLDAAYWRRNVRDVVRFDRALAALAAAGDAAYVELGGHPVLAMVIAEGAGPRSAVVGAQRRNEGGLATLYRALSTLHVAGYPVDWSATVSAGPMAQLPTYAFQRRRLPAAPTGAASGPEGWSGPSLPQPRRAPTGLGGIPAPSRIGAPRETTPRLTQHSAATLPAAAQRHLDEVIRRVHARTPTSRRRAAPGGPLADARVVAGWSQALSPEAAGRWAALEPLGYPLVVERGDGAHVQDVDGRRYLDLCMGFGVHLLGHRPRDITDAVVEACTAGAAVGPQSHLAQAVAEQLARLTGMDRVAFANTGSEAVSMALRLARARTGRQRIAIARGSYHGTADAVVAPTSFTHGIPHGALDDVVLFHYGVPAELDRLDGLAGDLAAVLIEPIQSRHPDVQPKAFLEALRRRTREWGTALIFDEVLIGFRIDVGGAQAHFGVEADLATYGKVIGGGLPIGAVGGRGDWLDPVDGGARPSRTTPSVPRILMGGTFSKNPVTMAAAHAILSRLERDGEAIITALNARVEAMARRLNVWFEEAGFDAEVIFAGSLFRFVLPPGGELLRAHLLLRGIYFWSGGNCFLSPAHTDDDVESLVEAVRTACVEMRDAGWWTGRRPPAEAQAVSARMEPPAPPQLGLPPRLPIEPAPDTPGGRRGARWSHARLFDALRDALGHLVGRDPASISGAEVLVDLGMNSLSMMEFSRFIRRMAGVDLRSASLYEELPTLDALAGYVAERMAGEALPAAAMPAADLSAPGRASMHALFERLPPEVAAGLAAGPAGEADLDRWVGAMRVALVGMRDGGWWASDTPPDAPGDNRFRAAATSTARCRLTLQAGTGGPTVVLFSALSGSAHVYQPLVRALGPSLRVWAMEAPELAGHRRSPETLAGLGALFADELAAADLDGRGLVVVGYSFGGCAALDTVAPLRARGVRVERVVVIDEATAPSTLEPDEVEPKLEFLARTLGLDPAPLHPMRIDERVAFFSALMATDPDDRAAVEREIWQLVAASRRNRQRLADWCAHDPGVPVVVLRTEGGPVDEDGWRAAIGGALRFETVPGDHRGCMRPPHVEHVARAIEQAIAEAERGTPEA